MHRRQLLTPSQLVIALLQVPPSKYGQLEPQPIDRRRPADGHEWLGAAARVGARTAIEPARADHRLRDPGAMAQAVDDVAEQRGGIGVVAIGVDRDDRAVRDLGFERSPVRRVRNERAPHARQDIKAWRAVAEARGTRCADRAS